MLKKFFISMLGSMAALWLSLILLIIGAVVVIGMLAGKAILSSGASLDGDRILCVKLTGSIPDRDGGKSLSDLIMEADEEADDLESILKAIRLSADDKKIKGIFIDCAGSSLGVASRGEMIEALKVFKESGKFVYAYSDNYEQGDYYIASVADSVFLNPVGLLNVHGLCSTTIFYKDVLDKLGIDINVVRVGSFKSAVEPYMRMDMSPESRLQMSVFINNIWQVITGEIASNRDLDGPQTITAWADSIASFAWAPEQYVASNAVSALRYRSQVEDMLRKKMDVDKDKELPWASVSDYLLTKDSNSVSTDEDHIAVLYAVGDIVDDGDGGIVGSEMVPQILTLAKDKHVKGLVLRVNSGGGSAFASEQIWKALEDFKAEGKPFYVSMADYAASGGYYISCGADKIFCDATTLTGSIGIFGVIPNAQKLLKDKIGLGFAYVESNPNANFPSITQTPTAEQLDAMQTYVNRGYETFTSRVAQGRSIPQDSVKAIGGGRIWDGTSALRLGLVDEIGGLYACIDAIADNLGMKASDIVAYPKLELSPVETIIKATKKQMTVEIEGVPAEETQLLVEEARRIISMSPLQTRMERIIVK